MVSNTKGFKGLTEAQSDLIAHWYTKRRAEALPTRRDLDPGSIRQHLRSISMLEIDPSGRARFRLVGSDLRRLFGREMRGRFLNELDQDMFEKWSLGLLQVLDCQRPVGGVITGDRDSHAWLRLPLNGSDSTALVLCHDCLIPNARLTARGRRESNRIRTANTVLAA
ncbi:MAG: PAS domain-containing protein [Pseudomonadota bacterium]